MNKKVIGFDLDGTLTQHKTPLDAPHTEMLRRLSEKYRIAMFGAGACERIYRQMNCFPVEIIGNYGMQHSVIENGQFKLVENQTVPCDREKISRIAARLRELFHLEKFYGDSVEFHASGCITFPILGTKAPIEAKLAYDPDRVKRRKMFRQVCEAFDGLTVFIGGSSSFDITPHGYDKFHAMKRFCEQNHLTLDEVLYVGDDFGEGGNDSHVRLGGVDCIEIRDYKTTPAVLEFLLTE